ncbi:Flp family type IVb pilin [bacterium]|nr:Flp family type IVb pilin [bacterium]
MQRLGRFFSLWLLKDDGQTLMEYAVILLLIALAVIAALTLFGGQVLALYNRIVGSWP